MDKLLISIEQRNALVNVLNELPHKIVRNSIDLLMGLPASSPPKSEFEIAPRQGVPSYQEMLESR